MRLGSKRFPSSGFALAADFELTTASATVGVCTITVFLVPVSSQPAAFPTATTKTPPISAATIAITAGEPGRARTDRTVAAEVLGTDKAQTRSSTPLETFHGKSRGHNGPALCFRRRSRRGVAQNRDIRVTPSSRFRRYASSGEEAGTPLVHAAPSRYRGARNADQLFARSAAGSSAGNTSENAVRPGWESSSIRPPISSASCLAIASPRPLP